MANSFRISAHTRRWPLARKRNRVHVSSHVRGWPRVGSGLRTTKSSTSHASQHRQVSAPSSSRDLHPTRVDTPPRKQSPSWRVNHETQRIEVMYPGKPDYDERRKLKGKGFRWSPTRKAWVRKINQESAIKAQSLGFERTPDIGEPISGAQKAERELERIERSAIRHEAKAAATRAEAEEHYKEARKMADVIPFGQPIHGASDRRYRERIHKKQEKFVEKYRESEHEKGVSERVKKRAEYMKKNPAYASKKAEALDTEIRRLDRRLDTEYDPRYGGSKKEFDEWQSGLKARKREATEEREYWSSHLKSLGGTKFSKGTIKTGGRVLYRGTWYNVERVNPKSVTLKRQRLHGTFTLKYREIRDYEEGS